MKRFLDFAMTTALGGLLVVVPGLLLALIADDMLLMVEGLVAPIADLLPADHIGGASMATVVALLMVFAFCFLFGLIARTTIGSRAGGWVERSFLHRIPSYGLLKTLSQQLAGVGDDDESSFAPAVLSVAQDAYQLAYIIEEHEDGFVTVMIPSVPAGLAGPLQYVREERVRRLDVPLAMVLQSLQTYGVGAGEFFAQGRKAHLQ